MKTFIVTGTGDAGALAEATDAQILGYEELLAAETPGFAWPDVDERSAAAMCYTSGTTGNPKGVVYSHRSTWLHSFAVTSASSLGVSESDRILPIVPMFHANAWGLPYAGWLVGADFLMPGRFLQPEPLTTFIAQERPTFSGAVPTIWAEVLRYGEDHEIDLSSFRMVVCGGSAVPAQPDGGVRRALRRALHPGLGHDRDQPARRGQPSAERHRVRLDPRTSTGGPGRVGSSPGVELRIVDDVGRPLPWDDEAVGEIEVRGPWITASYYLDPSPEKFDDGWLRTGDVGRVDEHGFIQITDRAKDVIKSGGEWISSVELEGLLMAHPDVVEASVVGVPDDKWGERPLACVVLKTGSDIGAEGLCEFLGGSVARWQLPERWSFIDEVPEDQRGQVRQEGPAGPPRRRRARDPDPLIVRNPDGRLSRKFRALGTTIMGRCSGGS